MIVRNRFAQSLVLMLAAGASHVHADESLWLYAKGTDTRPKGSTELKISDITKIDKNSGDYVFHDIRPEIEYGITDRLTLSVEWMLFHHDYSVDDENLNPMFETQGGAGKKFKDTQVGGYELGLKYNVLSPYSEWMGLALGVGYEKRLVYRLDGAEIDQDSVTLTTFLQKNYLDDRLSFALVPKFEFERRRSADVLEEEIALDVAAGVSYRVAPSWFLGLEFRHQSDYLNPQEAGDFNPELKRSSFDSTDFRVGSQHQNGNYFGPTVHYGGQKWWVTAGVLWQVKGGGSKFSYSKNGKNWDEHEKMHLGLTYAKEF
jgi:opacity protein-like surface antigen